MVGTWNFDPMKIHNFSAGPCILPETVLKEASEAVSNFNGLGLSLVEISHRSPDFVAVMEEARALVKELLNLPDRFDVLFLQGGASLGFLTAAYNFLPEGGRASYIDSGTWANKAVKEAKHLGAVDVIGSSKDTNYNCIPNQEGASEESGLPALHVETTPFSERNSRTPRGSMSP
jgi:phosphoserine aminotransferase